MSQIFHYLSATCADCGFISLFGEEHQHKQGVVSFLFPFPPCIVCPLSEHRLFQQEAAGHELLKEVGQLCEV